jgi:hypothetical protein
MALRAGIAAHRHRAVVKLVGDAGIEPALEASETSVLPLNESPVNLFALKRDAGIEPAPFRWRRNILPLNQLRI